MGDKQETVADIVREMFDYDGVVEEFATRIESAYDLEMRSAFKILRQCNQELEKDNAALRAKIGRLEKERLGI